MRPSARIRRSALVAVGVVVAAVGGVVAPAQAGPVLAVRFQGQAAFAVWSTCPGEVQPGQACEETVVMAFDARTRETTDQPSGPHFLRDRDDVVVLQRFWSEARLVDGELMLVPLRESFGRTTAADVAVSQRLTAGTARSGPISMHTTDYVAGTETTETDSVVLRWSPTGPLSRIRDLSRSSERWALQVESTKGWERTATATGTVDGAAPAGGLVSGSLVSVTQRSQLVLRGHTG